ncbi:hypothetical protein ACLQ2P_41495 [Actinomadura citrea]|uniref:hypothetical protein n=1 Tax=Actinomadura citrea TaxID=46158 RepID=UPI003CE5241D
MAQTWLNLLIAVLGVVSAVLTAWTAHSRRAGRDGNGDRRLGADGPARDGMWEVDDERT